MATELNWKGNLIRIDTRYASRYLYLATETALYINGREITRTGGIRQRQSAQTTFSATDNSSHTLELRVDSRRHELLIDGESVATGATVARGKGRAYAMAACLALLLVAAWNVGTDGGGDAQADLPPLPVQVRYREALLGPGLVAQFANAAPRHLSVIARFSNATTGSTQSFRLDLDPGRTAEVGHLQGWTFASGDTIDLEHAEYRSLQFRLP